MRRDQEVQRRVHEWAPPTSKRKTSNIQRSIIDNANDIRQEKNTKIIRLNPSQTTLTHFKKARSREEIISELVCKDGFAPNAICKSSFLHQFFQEKGMKLPKSPSTIMEIIQKYYILIKEQKVNEIKSLIQKGQRFSISLDEFTSMGKKDI